MLAIKPHHFVDILTGLGDGRTDPEPHPFGHAVHTVTRQLMADPELELRLDLGADDICAPCRHNRGGLCVDVIDVSFRPEAPASKRAWNLRIDQRWCARLGVVHGDRMTARQLAARIDARAGEIADIYREEPTERTAQRQARLRRGLDTYLGGPSTLSLPAARSAPA